MTTLALTIQLHKQRSHSTVCKTARGRALHTVDWFLNGERHLNDYDKPALTHPLKSIGEISCL